MHSIEVGIDTMEPSREQPSQPIKHEMQTRRTLSMVRAIIYLSETYLTPVLETSHILYGSKLQRRNFREFFENHEPQVVRDIPFFLKLDFYIHYFQ